MVWRSYSSSGCKLAQHATEFQTLRFFGYPMSQLSLRHLSFALKFSPKTTPWYTCRIRSTTIWTSACRITGHCAVPHVAQGFAHLLGLSALARIHDKQCPPQFARSGFQLHHQGPGQSTDPCASMHRALNQVTVKSHQQNPGSLAHGRDDALPINPRLAFRERRHETHGRPAIYRVNQ